MDTILEPKDMNPKSGILNHKTVVVSIFQTVIANNQGYTISSCYKIIRNDFSELYDPDVIVIDIEPIMHMTPIEFQKILMLSYSSLKFESTTNEGVKNLILTYIEELIMDSKAGKQPSTRIIIPKK